MTITNRILEIKVKNLNEKMRNEEGKGLVLEYAYGGVRLCKVCNEHGGLRDLSERVSRPEMARILDSISNLLYSFNLQ